MTLEQLQARKAAAEAKKAELDSAQELSAARREAEKAEMDLADAEAEAAQDGEKGKDWAPVYTDYGVVIVKRAHPAILKAFTDQNKTKFVDILGLIRPCVVHPEKSRFDEMIELQPLMLGRCLVELTELGGARLKAAAPK